MGLLIRAYNELPDKARAFQQLQEKAADSKAPVFYPLALAMVYEKQKEGGKAIAILNGLLERKVASQLIKNNLAYLLAEHQPTPENLARAQQLASEALDDNPGDPRILDTLGWIYCAQGNYAQARPLLEEAAPKVSNNPVVQYHLGFCLAKLGDKDAARQVLEKALALKGDFPDKDAAQKLLEELKNPAK